MLQSAQFLQLDLTVTTNMLHLPDDFKQMLSECDEHYRLSLQEIPLFNATQTPPDTQKKFAATFYHIRGHFIDFMWFIANFSSNNAVKDIIINNIKEEIGHPKGLSHEMLYERFANACGVDVIDEIIHNTNNHSFIKTYNKTHIEWLSKHDENMRLAAFAAYERLDNIDYVFLNQFGTTFLLPEDKLLFFKVHIHVEHFERTLDILTPIFNQHPDKIKQSFDFIYQHQRQMWQDLSDYIYSS